MSDPLHDYAHDATARSNRAAKAMALADQIDELGHLPDVTERIALRRRAGYKSASDETWTMAIDIWRERQAGGP